MLKWQAKILNKLYETNLFDKIVLPSSSIDSITYSQSLAIYQSLVKPISVKPAIKVEEFIDAAHVLCRSKDMDEKRKQIIYYNQVIAGLERDKEEERRFSYYHVIVFSSLSKCTIWPGMFKTSQKLLPSLIQFYSNFHSYFKQFLDYKFDPLILSTKFNKIVKNIKQKRLSNPQLFQAVAKNQADKIIMLAADQPHLINQCIKEGLYITHYAAIHSNIQTLRLLLNLKANFELLDLQKQTSIFYAVKRFDLQIVKFFVEEAKVDINHCEYQNRTPIYLAAFEGKLQIVDYLYSKGADPQIQSKLARTPLSKACYLGNAKVAEYLIKLGVRIEAVDSKGRTALHNAAWGIQGGRQGKRRGHIKLQDSPQCVQLLLKAGHKIDFEDFDKFTPLFSAISSHAERSLRILVNHGANLHHKTIKNETAVFIASKYGHLPILKILIQEYKCNFLQQNNQGYSPFAASLTLDDHKCTFYLLDTYLQHKISPLKLRDILRCVVEYKKISNCSYILQWLSTQDNLLKIKYFAEEVNRNLEELLGYALKCQISLINNFFRLLKKVQRELSNQSFDRLFQAIQSNRFYTNETLAMILNRSSYCPKISILALNQDISQTTVLQLLSIKSALIHGLQNIYQTFTKLIQMKFTKAILYLLQGQKQSKPLQTKKNISENDINKILFQRTNGKISISDYCLVHGHYDIHKIISTIYNDKFHQSQIESLYKQRPKIPNYNFSQIQTTEVKAYLHPVDDLKGKLVFKQLVSDYLSEQDFEIYKEITVKKASFTVNPIIVKTKEDLQIMMKRLQDKKVIGVDIEHYSSPAQSFICLIQLSTFQQVFIIDQFNYIHELLTNFLVGLFKDKQIIKIFHSYDNDLKWLVQDFQIQEFHNIFDTARVYAFFGQQKNHTPSLKYLASNFLGLQVKKEYQKSDWRIRPLFNEMLEYAGTDAKILPFLLLRMIEELNTQNIKRQSFKLLQSKRVVKAVNYKNIVKIL